MIELDRLQDVRTNIYSSKCARLKGKKSNSKLFKYVKDVAQDTHTRKFQLYLSNIYLMCLIYLQVVSKGYRKMHILLQFDAHMT
jgi:hypothetical protein